jgi:NitT/TauT family transport system permease protein
MKIAAPLALIGAVVGEFVGANRGIGFAILDAAARLATVQMLAGIVYVGLTGTALFLAQLAQNRSSGLGKSIP